ncbi:MAG: nucleoside recognition domain-containing protein [Crocinitomicaceae bacterium]|jgi:spore maturation protein SpmA
MLLNRIWIGMFLIALVTGLSKLIFWHDLTIFEKIVSSLFDAAKSGFEICLFFTGTLCLWLGFMKIGEEGGAVRIMTRFVSPLFSRLFPEVPKNHPAIGSMMMNISANMLGLDNAATPMGLKAMKELQTLNPEPERATNAQIMFLVLNASGLTIIPVSILALRSAEGSASPSEVFLPILISTYFATLGGLIYLSIKQRINLFNKVVFAYIGSISAFIIGLLVLLVKHPEWIAPVSGVGSNLFLFLVICFFVILAIRSKVNVYDSFIEGAKGGFEVAIGIVPFLIAMLAAIAVFRASGALEAFTDGIKYVLMAMGVKATEFVDALPVALMKPFSGSGARALMVESWSTFGVDSFVGKLASTFQGSTETTFYVLAVYFGAVKVKNTRYAAMGGIVADIVGFTAAILVSYLFYAV